MRVEFNKTIEGKEELNSFINTRGEGFYKRPFDCPGYFYKVFDYNLEKLEDELFRNLESSLKSNDMPYTRLDKSGIWIREPNKVILNFSSIEKRNVYGNYMEDRVNSRNIGSKKKKGFIGSKDYPILEEIPLVKIEGRASFETQEDVSPEQILNLLDENGYHTKIISTNQEQIELAEASRKVVCVTKNFYHDPYPGLIGIGESF